MLQLTMCKVDDGTSKFSADVHYRMSVLSLQALGARNVRQSIKTIQSTKHLLLWEQKLT
jgi:hypothetical protein